ncbi:MAG: hypothetical protein KDA60_21010, partial [Planctomycetales bacterium]|nr:hypothetical protein [Planctomycetales bacterium]
VPTEATAPPPDVTQVAEARDVERLQQQLRSLTQQLQQKQTELQQLQDVLQKPDNTYAIMPYAGKRGTRRRPIYIECRGDRVLLQPSGLELLPQDFKPPLGPTNPLAAALLATRDYWQRTTDPSQDAGTPYPLLLVRPDGAQSYAACREAMRDWRWDFGYELIDEAMKLSFPPPDPQLAELLAQTIETSRQRARTGEYIVSGDLGASGEGVLESRSSSAFANSGTLPQADSRSSFPSTSSTVETDPSPPMPPAGQESSNVAAANARPSRWSSGPADSTTTGTPTATNGDANASHSTINSDRASDDRFGPLDDFAPRTSDATDGAQYASQQTTRSNGLRSTEESVPGGPATAGQAGRVPQPQLSFGAQSTPPAADTQQNQHHSRRQQNWGLPIEQSSGIGIKRPVFATIDGHRITLLPEPGSPNPPKIVELNTPSTSTIDTLVSAIGQQIRAWGAAGPDMYWKPILQTTVAPGGAERLAEIQRLLDGSGIEVMRR